MGIKKRPSREDDLVIADAGIDSFGLPGFSHRAYVVRDVVQSLDAEKISA